VRSRLASAEAALLEQIEAMRADRERWLQEQAASNASPTKGEPL
jgi:hypothetical protein